MVGAVEASHPDPARVRRGLRLLTDALNAFAEATIDYPRLLETVTRNIAEAIGDACLMLLRSDDERTLEPVAVYDQDPEIARGLRAIFDGRLTLDQPTMARDVMLSGTPSCLPSLDLDEFARRTTPAALAFHRRIGTRGLLIVPLRVRGEALGALSIVRHRAGRAPLDDFDVEVAHDLAKHAAVAISNARLLRAANAELERRVAAEDAALFLEAIVENIPDMIFVKDANELAFTRLNRAGEELLGIPRAELLGKSDRDFFPPDEAQFFAIKDRDALRGKTLVDIPEEPIQTRSGQRWLHTKKVPIIGAGGQPLFLLGISQDITERKLADAALLAAKDAAEAANRELETFSYSVAHDLRAPLRGINGFSAALLEDFGDKLDEEARGYLTRIAGASQRMGELIDALLELARLNRAELRRDSVDLSQMARAVIEQLRAHEPGRSVDFIASDDLVTQGDPQLVRAILENLLGNAWKFTCRQPQAQIAFGCEDLGGTPVYFVRDNGAGFDMKLAEKLFAPFRRLHKESEFEGMGIGLATVQRIVGRHGGRIWADGSEGKGATFRFTLRSEAHGKP
jgi:PAS domain S-box-containing protein